MNKITFFVMDVDGTLTDGKIYIGNEGECFKAFSVKDGYGIHDLLPKHNITPVIITGRKSEILMRRCIELGIDHVYQSVQNKLEKLNEILANSSCRYSDVAYIGDDLNDFECMKLIHDSGGLVGCPADAAKQVKELADYVCEIKGGDGAVREFIEWIIQINEQEK